MRFLSGCGASKKFQLSLTSFFLLLTYIPYLFAASRIDLVIEKIQFQPARASSNIAVTANILLRNNGSEPVDNFHLALTLFKNGKEARRILDIPVLGNFPRSGAGLALPVNLGMLEEGDYEIVVDVDSRKRYDESDENNNQYSQSFRVWPAAYGMTTV